MSQNESPTYGQIDRAIRGLKEVEEQENPLLPESFDGLVQRLARVYAAVQPLLATLTILPLLPPSWRKAIKGLTDAVEAVVAGAAPPSVRFKAGRDL